VTVSAVSTIDVSDCSQDLISLGAVRAARQFAKELRHSGVLEHVERVGTELFGSLGTDRFSNKVGNSVVLGLSGQQAEQLRPERIRTLIGRVVKSGVLELLALRDLSFERSRDLLFHCDRLLPGHENGLRFTAFNKAGEAVHQRIYYTECDGEVIDEAIIEHGS
jgi:L-serine dehydratase